MLYSRDKTFTLKTRVQILKGTIKFNPANSYSKKEKLEKKIETNQKSQDYETKEERIMVECG